MSYLVLARKYRPQTFDKVIAQEHVTRTLSNAINSGRVAHAILLTGPRGTGKTTVARILAKAMNCKTGPQPVPCNECRSCVEITSGNAVDVIEIDGASNNSVDQVRDLRENLKYMPAHSRFKIYIIDEVHMLSQAAFNALLKTLEEPPSHVMFIFATTEPHKIPITILSRCQRHDFRRIDTDAISAHMAALCNAEGIAIAEESLALIAREAGGSMRDALSLLDQVATGSSGSISQKQVMDILGVIDHRILFDISGAILDRDMGTVLERIDHVYQYGLDMKKLYAELAAHFRDLLVVKVGQKVNLLVDRPSHEIERMRQQVKDVSPAFLNQTFNMLYNEETTLKYTTQPKLALETVFFRLFQVKPVVPIERLIDRLEALRREVTGDDASGIAEAPSIYDTKERPAAVSRGEAPETSISPKAHEDEAAPLPPSCTGEGDTDRWQAVTERISQEYPALAPNLANAELKSINGDQLEIEVGGNGFNINMIKRPRNLSKIGAVCRDVFGKEMQIKITGNPPSKKKKQDEPYRLKQEALRHPLVADVIECFDGRVVDVKVLSRQEGNQ